MSVIDVLYEEASGAKTEVIVLDRMRLEQTLREKLHTPILDKKLANYQSRLSEKRSKAIVVHGLQRADAEPAIRVYRPTPDFHACVKKEFMGPVDMYQYSPKNGRVICVSRFYTD